MNVRMNAFHLWKKVFSTATVLLTQFEAPDSPDSHPPTSVFAKRALFCSLGRRVTFTLCPVGD